MTQYLHFWHAAEKQNTSSASGFNDNLRMTGGKTGLSIPGLFFLTLTPHYIMLKCLLYLIADLLSGDDNLAL